MLVMTMESKFCSYWLSLLDLL